MNKKGQALVEFVLILPLFIYILMVLYDFGMIFNLKNEVNSHTSDIIGLVKNGKTLDDINELYDERVTISNDEKYYIIIVEDDYVLVTPGLSKILGNPYEIIVKRYISYE